MSILVVLLMFLLIISIRYFVDPKVQPALETEIPRSQPPLVKREYGFDVPQGYCFHPGHMWAMKQGADDARVGIDKFVTNLMGAIDHIEVRGADHWVRQGQKLVTIRGGGTSIDLLSPVEGVITAINNDVLQDPSLLMKDPYDNAWIAVVKSPDLQLNQRNLVQGGMVPLWMQHNLIRLNAVLSPTPALAQDGGGPICGLLPKLSPELRQKVAEEFFLS